MLAAYSCSKPASRDATQPPAAATSSAALLSSAPQPENQVNIAFGDKVTLLGFDVSETPLRTGRPLRVTWYWRVDAPLEQYRLLSQLSDGSAYRQDLAADRPLARSYPEARWKPGDLIRDEQTLTLPADWRSNIAVFYMAFDAGAQRLPAQGYTDGDGRAEVVRLAVLDGLRASDALPSLLAHRISTPVTIDGALTDAAWREAPSTAAFVDPEQGEPATVAARARVLYDERTLYAGVAVADDDLQSGDAVELQFDPRGDGQHVHALRVDLNGAHGASVNGALWSVKPAVQVQLRGAPNDGQPDGGYQLELAVPLEALGGISPRAAGSGAQFRFQICVADARAERTRGAAWSPPMAADCRQAARFGRLLGEARPAQVK